MSALVRSSRNDAVTAQQTTVRNITASNGNISTVARDLAKGTAGSVLTRGSCDSGKRAASTVRPAMGRNGYGRRAGFTHLSQLGSRAAPPYAPTASAGRSRKPGVACADGMLA